jgi:hypothetical protein
MVFPQAPVTRIGAHRRCALSREQNYPNALMILRFVRDDPMTSFAGFI